jgi:hypothetical protein
MVPPIFVTPSVLLPGVAFYQLNMQNPNKTIADSFIFLFFSMILIAASLYLPQNIAFLTSRAWFYYNGDEITKVITDSTAAASASMVGMNAHTLAAKLQGTAEIQGREL